MMGNSITIQNEQQLEEHIKHLRADFAKHKFLKLTIESGIRTIPQNKAMYLYFTQVAKALSNAGIDTTNFFDEGYSLPFTEHIVKDSLWLPLMKAITNETSTSKINKKQVVEIYEHLNAKLAERGIHVPFPSNDNLMNSQRVR